MEKAVDLTKRVYSIQGTNLFFESRTSLIRFLHRAWGVAFPLSEKVSDLCDMYAIDKDELEIREKGEHIRLRVIGAREAFLRGYDILEYTYNDNVATIVEFLLISTDEQIEVCINFPSVKESSFIKEIGDKGL